MKDIVKICASFFILAAIGHLGRAQDVRSVKNISFGILCKEIKWTEHSRKSCNVFNLTVESLNNVEFEFTNLTFAREIKKFLDPVNLNETCFESGLIQLQVRDMNNSRISIRSSSNRIANGFIYDIECSQTRIQRYDTKVENMGPDGCVIKPLGIEDECRSQNFRVFVEVVAELRKLNNSDNFTVPMKDAQKRVSRDEASDCTITPNYNDTQFQLKLNESDCNALNVFQTDSNIFPPPTKCLDSLWNLYTWQRCSKLAFGEQVLHLDWRFDRWVLNNLTRLCGTNLVNMTSCLKENPLCKDPNRDSFNFYSKLQKSYDDICATQDDFALGNRCFQSIMINSTMKAAYVSGVQQCSSARSNDACMDYSKDVLCKASVQYKMNSSCTTFPVTYKYKKIIEDRNNAGGNCTSAQRDPCSLKDPKYKDICSSGSRIEVTFLAIMLLCLANWMKPGK